MRPGLRTLTISFLAACGDSTTGADGSTIADPTTGSIAPTTGSATPTSSAGPGTTVGSESVGTHSDTSSAVTSDPVTSTSSSGATTDETTATTTTSGETTATTTTSGETTATTGAALCGLDPAPAGAIAVSPACSGGVAKDIADPYDLTIEWKYLAPAGMYAGIHITPAVGVLRDDDGDGDVDADDDPIIALVERTGPLQGALVVLRGDGSGPIFKVPGMTGGSNPAIGDIDQDGAPDIVAVTQEQEVVAIDNTGTIKWVTAPLAVDDSQNYYNTLADLDGDGDIEVLSNSGIHDGKTGALITPLNGTSSNDVTAADLDLDGQKEIILGLSAYSNTGALLWGFGGSSVNRFSAILNTDADPEAEVYLQDSGRARLYEHDGTMIWTTQLDVEVAIHIPALPCVADFDGDGEPEIGAPQTNEFTMLNADGTVLWKRDIAEFYSSGGCAGYDVEGDGAYEVFHVDRERFWIFDGATGTTLYSSGLNPDAPYRSPVIADVDKDGSAEVLVTTNNPMSRGLYVYGHATNGWSGAGRTWASHDYAVTNQNPDGSVPSNYEPPWLTDNLFRSRPTVDAARADLAVRFSGTCIDCANEAQVAIQICNQGGLDVAAGVPITLYSLDAMIEVPVATHMLPAVASGECLEGDVFSFDPALIVDGEVVVRLHDDGIGPVPAHECNGNNDRAAAALTAC